MKKIFFTSLAEKRTAHAGRQQVAHRVGDAQPLLLAVKRRSGWAALINTSFNTKGRPILNTAREALALLEADGLDGVLIEDVLVTRKAAR